MQSIFFHLTRLCALAALLAGLPAMAGITNVAQVPILSIKDTGTVKPNLMLIYDNSGSMAYTYTPDYVNDSTTCRSRLTMGTTRNPSTTMCAVGHPPYNSPDFNRQSYNPAVLYLPPVDATGASYPSLTRANTSGWSAIKNDAFGVDTSPLSGSGTTINLVTGFPDLRWCDGTTSSARCVYNSASYNYPDNTYIVAKSFTTNPYYYSIRVSEYCTDATLVTCKSVVVGAPAPAGYPTAAKVRFCNSVALTNCQAKYVGAYIYPRFGDPAVTPAAAGANGLVTINRSASSASLTINSVSVTEASGDVVITNGAVVAGGGTPDAATQAALANALAASIIAKTGLTNQYLACVRTPPAGSTVPACSTYGITLGADNVLAVVAIDCTPGATSKTIGQCSLLADDTRNGWAITVQSSASAGTPASGVITVGGTAVNSTSNPTKMATTTLGGATLFSSVTFASSSNSTNAAAAIAAAITSKATPGITAIQGGQAGCSGSASTVCVTTSNAYDSQQTFSFGAITNNSSGTGKLTVTGSAIKAGTPPVQATNITTSAIGAGTSIFVRTDIVATRSNYPKARTRTDCAGSSCTYDEEMTNFANWYSYYKTRNQMMKTSVGLAFNPIDSKYNVGLVSLSAAAATSSTNATFGRPLPFIGDVRKNWYASLYGMVEGGSTPLRTALNWVGQMYANGAPFNFASGSEAIQAPCQQNFTFITTDGYWNGAAAGSVASNDNKEDLTRFCTKATGCVDPRAQTAGSLADVALYWYNGGSNTISVSLRPSLEDMSQPGLVKGPDGDNKRLHMNTYTLGLGVDGIMNYEANYDTSPLPGGDFSKLVNNVQTGCPWNNNGPYVWPDPATGDSDGAAAYQTRVDDLWHTAINGRGKYFSASDPTEVISGLRSALSHIASHVGAASSAATSTPNISVEDNDIFSNTFTTVQWSGELTDKKVDVVTGAVSSVVTWSVSKVLGNRVTATGDTRQIKMLDVKSGTLVDFAYENLPSPVEQGWFDNQCGVLAQCTKLSDSDRDLVNTGSTIIGWLRGQQQYANDVLLRAYGKTTVAPLLPIILGDIASSKPAYVRDPRKTYTLPGYADYVSRMTNVATKRAPAVYVGANDGMLHAFNAATGDENWAYVPRITMKKLAAQASTDYGTNHQFTVDGSPEVGDVQITTAGVTEWRSILVAGLNGGGRGYYAVDVTDPLNPKAMWETCADPTVCTGVNNEPELGLTFGNPQIGTWVDKTGATRWVVFVTSGYNNVPDKVSGGSGQGWLMVLDIQTGAVLAKTSTGSGTTTTPSGLGRITGITADPSSDPKITVVYGGDTLGQMWRFDTARLSDPTYVPVKMGDAGTLQPITARPDVTMCKVTTKAVNGSVSTANKIVVAFGTGRLLDVPDVTNKDTQSIYVLRDTETSIGANVWRGATMTSRPVTKTTSNAGDTYTVSGNAVDFSTQIGWYTDLNQNGGERINLDPKIVTGSLNIVSNIPSASSACSVGGQSNIYQFDVCNGTGDAAGVVGRTLSGSSATVGFIVVSLSSGAKKIIATLADGSQIVLPAGDLKDPVSRRSGWRRIRN